MGVKGVKDTERELLNDKEDKEEKVFRTQCHFYISWEKKC